MERKVTVAAVNFQTAWGDKRANLEKMKNIVTQAASRGIDMVAFPELALSGYECDEGCHMHKELAEPIPGPSTEEMAKLAAEHNLYVVFGLPEQDSREPTKRYISTAVVGPEGILGAYRKIHLSEPPLFTESECFVGGRELPVFKTRFCPIGIQICYDFWIFPELTRILTLKGAEIVINTTASPAGPGKPYYLVQQTGARATENTIYTISANLVGQERKRSFYGHSAVAGPDPPRPARIFAEGGETEEVVSATLNLEATRWWRQTTGWMRARRAEVILNELKALSKE